MSYAEIIIAGAGLLISALYGIFAYRILTVVPSRKEFEMHIKQDDERQDSTISWLQAIEMQIRDTKTDILRELSK